MTATSVGPDFPVAWDDPADAERTWNYDPVHMPGAIAPLSFELGTAPFLEGFGWGMRPIQVNYYIYFTIGPRPETEDPDAGLPDVERIARAGARWREVVLPEVLDLTERYVTTDFDALDNEGLASEIERLRDMRYRAGQLHTMAIGPHWQGMSLLVDTYRKLTGGDELSALRLLQGYPNTSFAAGERLWRVSRVAAGIPSVRERLLALDAQSARQTLVDIEADDAAGPFLEAFRAYLDEYGWRTGGEFAEPTWLENPTVALTTLRSYLEAEDYDPTAEQRRLVEERDAAVRETLAQLAPGDRRRLEQVLAAAREVVSLSEDHNHYLDQRLYNSPRRLVLAAGRRLVAKNVLREPRDVFFLRVAELTAALRGDPTDRRDIAPQRREELRHWRTVTPPAYIGAPPSAAAGGHDGQAPAGAERADKGELRGTGVSTGVARGPARVILRLDEASRLRPGDVLVTKVTQPSWTPLFGVARAIVTEVGGMLSHTAIAAREYGLPAVVNVHDATRILGDGQLVEVDGAVGTVRVVS